MPRDPETALRLARLALAALPKTSRKRRSSFGPMLFLLNANWPRPTEEVVSELVSLPKPVICVGHTPPDGMLMLGYWILEGDSSTSLLLLAGRQGRAVLDLPRARRATRSTAHRVALIGSGGIESLTWEEFTAFREDYHFPLAEWRFKRSSRKLARSGFGMTAKLRLANPNMHWGTLTIHERAPAEPGSA